MQVWDAFVGYGVIYGKRPPARLVRRVRTYLMARNEYEYEQQQEHNRKMAEAERERQRVPGR